MALRGLVKKLGSPLNSLFRKISCPRAAARNSPVSVASLSLRHVADKPHQIFLPTPMQLTHSRHLHLSPACFNEHIINIQDSEDFKKRVLHSKVPTIVDFYATWCGPCKLLIPKLEQIVAKNEGKIILAKIDIDVLTELADSYQVSAVPTVIAMKNGKELDKFVGFKDDTMLESFVEKLLK